MNGKQDVFTAENDAYKLDGIARILIVRLRSIGDMILIGPAVHALRKAYPEAEISVITEPLCLPVVAGNPLYDRIITFDIQNVKKLPALPMTTQYLAFAAFLRSRRYDLVVDLHGGPRAAGITLLSGGRYRLGYDLRGRRWAYTIRRQVALGDLMIRTHLELVAAVGARCRAPLERGVTFPLRAAHLNWARDFVRKLPPADRLVVFHCGARFDYKCWPRDAFISLGKNLCRSHRAVIILVGGPEDVEKSSAIADAIGHRANSMAGRLPLARTAAVIARADCMVCNDSGPMHIAEALGRPIVALFGPSEAGIWAPIGEKNRVLRIPETDPAAAGIGGGISSIPVSAVYEACCDVLGERSGMVPDEKEHDPSG